MEIFRLNDWEPVKDQLAFMKIEGRHTGDNIGAAIVKTIDDYKLRGKLGSITPDAAIETRTGHDMMGLEYAVHIAAKHFADTVALTFNGEFNNEDVAQALASLGAGEDEPKGKGGDGYLHVAPVAHIFKECCVQAEVPVLVLLLWVRTRWASLYKCLDCCLILRKLADGSDEVPDLHHEQYHDCTPTKPEWEKIQIITRLFEDNILLCPRWCSRQFTIIPALEFLIKQ
ncbi:hypothetical protein B0H14DRAFT_2576353 [Mycena olivaceomarginata]|nr:hypothetical protein B0H14DRAFT_2576353 [Mycena olivaceomarginata]